MNKLLALLDLFRKGAAVTDPQLWKQRQIAATVLLPVFGSLVSALRAFGVEVPLDDTQITQLVTGLVVLLNLVLTLTTTDKIGLPAKPEPLEPSDITGSHDAGFDADIFKSRG